MGIISPYVFEVVGKYGQRLQLREELLLIQEILAAADQLEPHRRMLCLDVLARELPEFLQQVKELL